MKTLVEKFAFDTSKNPPLYANHTFAESAGQLEHSIDGILRAVVPVESLPEYFSAPNVKHILNDSEVLTVLDAFT